MTGRAHHRPARPQAAVRFREKADQPRKRVLGMRLAQLLDGEAVHEVAEAASKTGVELAGQEIGEPTRFRRETVFDVAPGKRPDMKTATARDRSPLPYVFGDAITVVMKPIRKDGDRANTVPLAGWPEQEIGLARHRHSVL